MDSSSDNRHHGVKSIQVHRARIKERIQEKHRQQSQQVRQGRLSALRETDSSGRCSTEEHTQWSTNGQYPGCPLSSSGGCPPLDPSSSLVAFEADGTLPLPAVEDWSDIGHEFGVDILDRGVMEFLLAIEDEIRQEQLFCFYDETNGNEWEEYYASLTL